MRSGPEKPIAGFNLATDGLLVDSEPLSRSTNVAEFCEAFETRVVASVPGQVTPLAGARELIASVRASALKLALASSSWHHCVDVTLIKAGRVGLFDAEVSGDDVARGKQLPDPMLLARISPGSFQG